MEQETVRPTQVDIAMHYQREAERYRKLFYEVAEMTSRMVAMEAEQAYEAGFASGFEQGSRHGS